MDPGYVECSSSSFLDVKLIMTGTAWISWQRPMGQQMSLWYACRGGDASSCYNQLESAASCTSYSD